MKKFIFITIYTFGIMLLSASPAFSKEFLASKAGCPTGTTPSTRDASISVTDVAIPILTPINVAKKIFAPPKENICVYEPPPNCQNQPGTVLIGVVRLPNGDNAGGQCLVRGSAEAKEALSRESNTLNAVGSSCPSGFLYIENIDGKKCYREGSDEYRTAANKAKIERLGVGKVGGTVKQYVVTYPIPCRPIARGQCPSVDTPAGYIGRLYQFSLMIVGLLAFASIIFGSLKYILSAGNLASLDEAKDQIKQSIMGVILLLGAYLILYTINPGLVSLRNPNLEPIRIQELIQDAEVSEDIQRLPPAGRGGADPLCKAAVNTNITINASQIGTSKCITCATNASTDSNGVCRCNQEFVQHEDACITPAKAEGLPDRSITDEATCNKTTNRIWRNGQCFHEQLGF